FKKDVRVETYPKIPDSKLKDYERAGNDADARNKFYDDWVAERISETHANGIFILATLQPRHLHIGVGRETLKREFTHDDRDNLQRAMLENFKKRNYDNGLRDALTQIKSAMLANRGERSAPVEAKPAVVPDVPPGDHNAREEKEGGIMGWLCPILLIIAGF